MYINCQRIFWIKNFESKIFLNFKRCDEIWPFLRNRLITGWLRGWRARVKCKKALAFIKSYKLGQLFTISIIYILFIIYFKHVDTLRRLLLFWTLTIYSFFLALRVKQTK